MTDPKYTLRNIEELKEQGRCCALSFSCFNEDCEYEFPRHPNEDRTTDQCPECGTLRKVCGNYKVRGKTRCVIHGGKKPSGIMSPMYQGKGLSVNLPTRLFEMYQLAVVNGQDGRLLEMEDDINLLEVRKADLVSQLSKEGTDKLWQEARKIYDKFLSARKRAAGGSPKAGVQMYEALDELEAVLVKGYTQGAIWKQLLEVIDAQKRLKESEIKRRKDASTIVTEEQVATAIGRIVQSIKERVKDQDVRAAILNDIQSMMIQ